VITLDKEASGLWIATLDRPEKANALTAAMLEELLRIAEEAAAARALVLTGRGRVFSAGMDLEAAASGLAESPLWERLSATLAALPGLTVCALNGTLAGGAMGMALACDLRVAVPGASVFYPVMKRGFLPQPSDPARLAALVGPARAKQILLAGRRIGAETALGWGLLDEIAADPLEAARALAADALAATPEHAAAIKRLIPTG
jgi:enoyl-CoA hydratase/carnithine racemase